MLLPIPFVTVRKPSEREEQWHMMASKAWQQWLFYIVTRAFASQHDFSACHRVEVWGVDVTFHTSHYKQRRIEAKNSVRECFSSNGWMGVQSCDISFDLFDLFSRCCTVSAKSDQQTVNRTYNIPLSVSPSWTCVNINRGRSSWNVCSLSPCFIPRPVCGLFVSCFHAWQLWHRFLPSWPCSLKCNKSCIPRLCSTSIRCSSASW